MSSLISVIAGSRRRFDPDALAYFSGITAAGSSITDSNKLAVDAFIKGCKTDGIWSAIKACCLLAGPDTLAGALVPLVGPAPSNDGSTAFVSGDYSRTTGLRSLVNTKRLNANYKTSADQQNNFSMSAWVVVYGSLLNRMLGNSDTAAPSKIRGGTTNWLSPRLYSQSNTINTVSITPTVGLAGISRSSSANYSWRMSGSSGTVTQASSTITGGFDNFVFSDGTAGNNDGLAFYHFGDNLNLALLDARLATYMSSLT